jgi:hypothetical protein
VALVRNDVSEQRIASIVMVERFSGLGIAVARKLLVPPKLRQLLVTANVVPSSLILFTLILEEIRSSQRSVITRATRRQISEDGIHQTN